MATDQATVASVENSAGQPFPDHFWSPQSGLSAASGGTVRDRSEAISPGNTPVRKVTIQKESPTAAKLKRVTDRPCSTLRTRLNNKGHLERRFPPWHLQIMPDGKRVASMEIHLLEDRIVTSTKGERRIKRRFRIEEDVRYKMLCGQRLAETGSGKIMNISSGG